MFGGGFFQSMTGGGSSPRAARPLDVGDPELDAWMERELDEGSSVCLLQLPIENRKRLAAAVHAKWKIGQVTHVNPYITRAAQQEANRPAPYGSNPRSSIPSMPPPAMSVPPMQQSPMSGGSPSAAAAAAAPASELPAWVTSAWAVHLKQPALFRAMHQHVGQAAIASISQLPGMVQWCALLCCLMDKEGRQHPEEFLKSFANMYMSLPAVAAVASSPFGQLPSGSKRLVVMTVGMLSGLEFSSLELALSGMQEFKDKVDIVERLAIPQSCSWPLLLKAVCEAAPKSKAVNYVPMSEAARHVQSKLATWRAGQIKVVAFVQLPPPQGFATDMSAAAPGYHAPPASEVWNAISLMKLVGATFPDMMLVAAMPPDMSHDDLAYFSKLFGKGLTLEGSKLGMPCGRRTVCTSGSPPSFTYPPRKEVQPPVALERLPGHLHWIFNGTMGLDVRMPFWSELEDIVDKMSTDSQLTPSEQEQVKSVRFAATDGGKGGFLDRSALAAICGVADADHWLLHWSQELPCCNHINSITGMATHSSDPEALACGSPRWCPNCVAFYECLTTACPPRAAQFALQQALRAGLGDDESLKQPLTAFSAMPRHQCLSGCTGEM